MKRINYLALAAAGLMMASCSQEDLVGPAQNGEGNYHVTVSLPSELGTRAMNDGLTATELQYTIWDVNNDNTKVGEGVAQFTTDAEKGLSTVVNLNLPNGGSYAISFFAQSVGSEKVYEYSDGKLVVYYDQMNNDNNQTDQYDCFVNLLETGVIGSTDVNTNVVLYRPMAQINWGTNDIWNTETKQENPLIAQYFGTINNANRPLPYMQSTLTTQAYNTFDLLANDVDTEAGMVDVNLLDFTQPANNGTLLNFPVSGYTYVAMGYLLAPKAGTVYDLTLNINNGSETNATDANLSVNYDVNVASAPVQANFRTNIYGALLTDNVEITVTKSPYWGGQNNLPQGDEGDAIEDGLFYNADTKTYTITSVEGLLAFSTLSNTSGTDLSGCTTLLAADLDLSSVANFTPINNTGDIFDGQGHKISNLTVNITDGNASAGFFSTARGTVQNIKFTNAKVSGNFKVGVLAGDGLCAMISGIEIDGAVVTSTPWLNGSVYDDGNNCGAVVGYLSAEPNALCTGCVVKNATVKAYRDVGGVVGTANVNAVVENNVLENVTVTADQNISGTYTEEKPFNAGEVAGRILGTSTIRSNTLNGVSVTTISSTGQVAANVASQAALQSAVGSPNAVITLQPGSYTPPTNVAAGVTFTGTKDAVITIGNSQVAGYTDVTFDGITFEGAAQNYRGFQHSKNLTYKNCTLNGLYFLYSEGFAFENCNFVQTNAANYNIWTYGGTNGTFTKCTFTCGGRALNVYQDGSATNEVTYTFTDCTFTSTQSTTKAALEIGTGHNYIINLNNCTATGFSTATNSGSSLWTDKDNGKMIININGEKVFDSIN